jgi:hypothetical protein
VREDFRRLATIHTFGDSWPRGGSMIAAAPGTHEPLRGQLFIHLAAYAGGAPLTGLNVEVPHWLSQATTRGPRVSNQ